MIIDGKVIASHLFIDLKKRVGELNEKGIEPHLVVILVGNDPASAVYVRQKEIKTKEIGAKITIKNLESRIQSSELLKIIQDLNKNKTVHGIIVQLPLPKHLDENIALKVKPEKDIDAFNPKSPYPMPLAKAVLKILENVYRIESDHLRGVHSATSEVSSVSHLGGGMLEASPSFQVAGCSEAEAMTPGMVGRATGKPSFINWMETQKIVVIGKGKTGGGPTIEMFKKLGLNVSIIDSRTLNPRELLSQADILISAVGKPNIVIKDMVKRGAILISVGMYKGIDGKLHGDYIEEEIKDIASYYTPVPGGVGPVNVACLIENLILAAEK